MKRYIKVGFQILLLITAIMTCYGNTIDTAFFLYGYALIYGLGLTYHLVFDKRKSSLFIGVFTLFVISSFVSVYFLHTRLQGEAGKRAYMIFIRFPWLLGLSLIFVRLLSDNVMRFNLRKKSLIILFILACNVFITYKITAMISEFNLGADHIFFSFVGMIVEMVLLSVGLIFYLSSSSRYRKTSILFGAFLCFFLSTLISSLNSLVYYMDTIAALNILEVGFSCTALIFFYMYCRTPNFVDELEQERFI